MPKNKVIKEDNIKPSDIKALVIKKSAIFGFLVTMVDVMVSFRPDSPLFGNYSGIVSRVVALFPLISLVIFIPSFFQYRCNKCKGSWYYRKVSDEVLDEQVVEKPFLIAKNINRYKVQEVNRRTECFGCGDYKVEHKIIKQRLLRNEKV